MSEIDVNPEETCFTKQYKSLIFFTHLEAQNGKKNLGLWDQLFTHLQK